MLSLRPVRLIIGLVLMIAAYVALIPGVTEPVLHLKTTLDKAELAVLGKEAILQSGSIPNFLLPMTMEVLNQIQVEGEIVVQDTSKSILGTAQQLWNEGNQLVGFLIVFFSVFIPALKLLLLAIYALLHRTEKGNKTGYIAGQFSNLLSKWSMADVFAMALIITFLAIQASSGTSNLVHNEISLQTGFYYFLTYCLLSILASQLLFYKPACQVTDEKAVKASKGITSD